MLRREQMINGAPRHPHALVATSCRGASVGDRLRNHRSLLQAQRPELIARHAVPLDRVVALEQSFQRRARKSTLRLRAVTLRARRNEKHGLMLVTVIVHWRNTGLCMLGIIHSS